ncbi:carotenoid isomerooxygenase [Contarinia nasturtii]|uniref:carotenoid isomerooxygenase n=1 Tax=Contarinia nasturtii TaxID=265458 RepID=UPI0012D3EE53|nr:carotenoid isomerooxygenase [Contarinia nasturtii]
MLKSKTLLTDQSFSTLEDKNTKLYPNCDGSVWLRSCEKEVLKPIYGTLHGHIPKWLKGCLLRNGPGSLNVGNTQYHHLFDSAALLHKFDISDGNVSYQCRFINTESYKTNLAANRIVVTSYGTRTVPDPCQTIFQRISSVFSADPINDNCNISIYPFGDEFYAFTECPIIHRIDIETLDTVGKRDIKQNIGVVNHTSHPHIMDDGTAYNLGLSVKNGQSQYNIIKFPNGTQMFENASIIAEIPARWQMNPSYMHSFATTDNYFIIIEQPLSISMVESLKAKYLKRPLASIFKWFQNECTLFHVICRRTCQRIFTFKAAPFFYLHTINAHERGDYIVVDICCYRDPSVLDCMYVEAMENMQTIKNYSKMFRSRPLRFVLPKVLPIAKQFQREPPTPSLWNTLKNITSNLSSSSIEHYLMKYQNTGCIIDSVKVDLKFWLNFESCYAIENLVKMEKSECRAYHLEDSTIYCIPERLGDIGCETPRINDVKSAGKNYRFFYAISSDVDADIPGTIIKVDADNKTILTWNERNVYPSEPIFVLEPHAENEDDGVILSAMVWGNGDENKVGLLVLCAKTLKELGRCIFKTPGPAPKCLHGWFTERK